MEQGTYSWYDCYGKSELVSEAVKLFKENKELREELEQLKEEVKNK